MISWQKKDTQRGVGDRSLKYPIEIKRTPVSLFPFFLFVFVFSLIHTTIPSLLYLMSSVENSTEDWSSNTVINNDDRGNDSNRGFTTSRILDSQNNATKLSPMQQQQEQHSQRQSPQQQQEQRQEEEILNDNPETMEHSLGDQPYLPRIPVAMRYPHVVSSVKQYRTEEQHQQLKQPFVSEAFISMMPNVTKPPRKRRRPPFSYSSLIAQAILEAENERLTLREIYDWIVKKYPSLYGANDIGWQVRKDRL